MSGEDGASVPPAQKAGWSSFLKSIASFSGDLSSLTAPPFILSPVSLAEFPSYWGEPTGPFADIAAGKTPEERHLRVTKWFLATHSGQFTRREKETGSEKKPLNPFLGEQFIGTWNDENGETRLFAEQVSHHPPVTAYCLENAGKGVSYEGHCAQKTSFSGRTIVVRQVGHGIVRVKLSDGTVESYLVTLPKLKIEGLWFGAPYVELGEHAFVQSSHGLTSTIEYRGKGYFSGKSHSFTATVAHGPSLSTVSSAHNPTPIHTIDGVWTETSQIYKGKLDKKEPGQLFLDVEKTKTKPITCRPVEEQGEFESRKVWKDTADGIRKGDFEAASLAKTKLENAERQKRKDELSSGITFQTRLFTVIPNDPQYKELAAMCRHTPDTEDSYSYKGKVDS